MKRDVAVVLSGGGMSGILLELGFLKRLRESSIWDRVGVVFGTSAGALSGCMAALDRLEALEEFLLRLRPEDTFRPNRLWRLPLLGTHDYVLPRTIAGELGRPTDFTRELAGRPIELVAIVTDVTAEDGEGGGRRLFERAYSSRSAPPEEMAEAMLASAAISTLVLPQLVGDRVATDGGWVRNYPLGYAYERPEIQQIVGFRYESHYPVVGAGAVATVAGRMRRFARLPAARALHRELEEALARERRGQPAHIVDVFSRLSRVAVIRNTVLEELVAGWREQSVQELAALRADISRIVESAELPPAARSRLAAEIDDRFADADFPFRHDRAIPRITVAVSAGRYRLEPGFRKPTPWTVEAKRALIERGYRATDAEFAVHGVV